MAIGMYPLCAWPVLPPIPYILTPTGFLLGMGYADRTTYAHTQSLLVAEIDNQHSNNNKTKMRKMAVLLFHGTAIFSHTWKIAAFLIQKK